MEKHVLTISRRWGIEAPILISVTPAGIALEVPLTPFLQMVALQAGLPADRLEAAATAVCEEVKRTTAGRM